MKSTPKTTLSHAQLSRNRNSHSSGLSHAMTASPKPFFRAPWRVGDAVVSRGDAGLTTSNSEHPCPCQNCAQGPPAEKTGRGYVLNHPSCPPWWPNWSRNWTELILTELNWSLIRVLVHQGSTIPQSTVFQISHFSPCRAHIRNEKL